MVDTTMEYITKTSHGIKNNPDAVIIRTKVFVEEQGFKNEFDDIDDTSIHTVVYDNDKPIATGRLFEEDGKHYVGRIAVIKEYREKKIGSIVMKSLESEAVKANIQEIYLLAQLQAKGFYEKLGYKSLNIYNMDEFCPHVTMKKNLSCSD